MILRDGAAVEAGARDALLARAIEVDASARRQGDRDSHGTRVIFGAGIVSRLREVVDDLGAQRVLLVASRGREDTVRVARDALGALLVAEEREVVMHVPAELAERVTERARQSEADLTVALGGGSAIGLAKAVALAGGPPYVAVPTTYSGSEMTTVWGITRDGSKETGRDERVRARAALYDLELSRAMPLRTALPSAFNALAHCIEARYAADATPSIHEIATEGARMLFLGMRAALAWPERREARSPLLLGAWMAGSALGNATMGVHHKLCHTLGGALALPHAETHAVVLPYSTAFNTPAAADAMGSLARAADDSMTGEELPAFIWTLLHHAGSQVGSPTSLAALGVREQELSRLASLATARPYPNPRPVTPAGVRQILEGAWSGERPALLAD